MPKALGGGSMLDWIDDAPGNIKEELRGRYDELSRLEQEQTQMGTAVPQLYGSLSRFIANPSTVSVETFKRMLDTDETIGSGIDFFNLCLIARFGEYKHPVADIQKFVRRALEQMETPWEQCLDEMFSAEWAGFSVTEQVWDYRDDFDGAPAFVPKKLVTYPPLTMVFAVDRHGEVLSDGIFQYQRFHNSFFNSYSYGTGSGDLNGFRPDLFASVGDYPYPVRIAADLTYLTVKIPRDKVIHLRSAVTGKFDNPYGRSVLRRVYKNWVLKDAFLNMWVVGADRKGTPLVVGYAAPNDTVLSRTYESDQANTGAARADVAMANVFKTIHNSSFIVLPGKKGEIYDIESVQIQGDMNVFKDGVEYFNRAIMRGLLIPPLVMSAGDGAGSFALGEQHHKIFNQTIDGKLKMYKKPILAQFIRKLIAYNFPRDKWEKHGYGDFVLEEFDPDVMEKLSNIYRNLTDTGYMTPDDRKDLEHVREKMGMSREEITTELDGDVDTDTNSLEVTGEQDEDDITDPAMGVPVSRDPNKQNNVNPGLPSEDILNGAQVTSLVDVVKNAASKSIPRESAIAIIMKAFKLSREEAETILGPKDFELPQGSFNANDPMATSKPAPGEKPDESEDDQKESEEEKKLPKEYNLE